MSAILGFVQLAIIVGIYVLIVLYVKKDNKKTRGSETIFNINKTKKMFMLNIGNGNLYGVF